MKKMILKNKYTGKAIATVKLPGRKRIKLAVFDFEKGNWITVATFLNNEMVELFDKYLTDFVIGGQIHGIHENK